LFSWANTNNPYELKETIMNYFPRIEKQKRFSNSEEILYKKGLQRKTSFAYYTSFENTDSMWNYDESKVDSTLSYEGNYSLKVQKEMEYPAGVKTLTPDQIP